MIKKISKAIIPVAGLGTRMLPATKAIPKELIPVYDRPIIEYVVKEAISAGIKEIIFVTRYGKEAIENHFDANYELEHRLEGKEKKKILGTIKDIIPEGIVISSVRQHDALGLGHAVLCAEHLLNEEPFAVLLPDIMILDQVNRVANCSFSKLKNEWDSTGIGQIMVQQVPINDVHRYGIIDLGDKKKELFKGLKVYGLNEKPEPKETKSNLAIIGRYILPYGIISFLKNTAPGISSEIQLTDALNNFIAKETLNAFETDAHIFDCGTKNGFLAANIAVGSRDYETKEYLRKVTDSFIK